MSEVRFGNYRIEEVLGSGAIATVYKAIQEPLGRVVAVKALKNQIAPTSSFGEQLEREAKVLADLAHPNVVLLLDVARLSTGRPYLVLEHIAGPSLQKLLAKRRKISVPAALAIACGICAGLEHVHERGVVHRDIKPGNVLLSTTGGVKIIDFGIAQRARTASLSDTFGTEGITASGRIAPEPLKDAFGTPAYMSPEQILGDFVDGRSDLFSLGVVLYEMLSGSRPFDAPPAGGRVSLAPGAIDGSSGLSRASRPPPGSDLASRGAAQRIRRDVPAPLRERAPNVPRSVERIVMRMLEKAPDDRYPNAGAVLERLQSVLRSMTREDPATLVRSALIEASFIKGQRTPKGAYGSLISPGSGISAPKALLGYAGLLVVFAVGAFAVEGSAASRSDNLRAAATPVEDAKMGGLRVVATPWAHVKVDGREVETTPFARAIPLTAGRHFVTLTHPDTSNVDREVDIVAGETVMLDVTMFAGTEDAGAPPNPAMLQGRDAGRDAR
ncbi:Serine/threonine-protein kinase PknB [Labilithrix luteola]|uniref:Serine/threonine-protein kinase PknB n=1 Tax=Labilithrix luteola TaxID=1391654 RepID=A0A0K1PRI0_9BACT|nr:serine/threonine-protein kinase [Labilithrix luteola]AKU96155.1 Serine/threonine-protein kinase PknB [Labilithrix luteola]